MIEKSLFQNIVFHKASFVKIGFIREESVLKIKKNACAVFNGMMKGQEKE